MIVIYSSTRLLKSSMEKEMSKTIRRKSLRLPDWVVDDYDEDGDYCYTVPHWSSRTEPSKWDFWRKQQRPTLSAADKWFHSDRCPGSNWSCYPSWAGKQLNKDARSKIKDILTKCKDWDDLCLPDWHKASNEWSYN